MQQRAGGQGSSSDRKRNVGRAPPHVWSLVERLCSSLPRGNGCRADERQSTCIALEVDAAHLRRDAGFELSAGLRNSRESRRAVQEPWRRLYVHGRSLLPGTGFAASWRMGKIAADI